MYTYPLNEIYKLMDGPSASPTVNWNEPVLNEETDEELPIVPTINWNEPIEGERVEVQPTFNILNGDDEELPIVPRINWNEPPTVNCSLTFNPRDLSSETPRRPSDLFNSLNGDLDGDGVSREADEELPIVPRINWNEPVFDEVSPAYDEVSDDDLPSVPGINWSELPKNESTFKWIRKKVRDLFRS